MPMPSWIRKLFTCPATRTIRKPSRRARLGVEGLEDRTVPAGADLFANATDLGSTASFTDTGSTAGFTGERETSAFGVQYGEPNHAGVSDPLASAWWKWTAPASGPVTLNVTSNDYHTVLAV